MAKFCEDFAEFERLNTSDRIELLDDLYRPDLGLSDAGIVLLPELVRVATQFDDPWRFNLLTCIGSIQHAIFTGERPEIKEIAVREHIGIPELTKTRNELRSLIDCAHTESWRQGIGEFIDQLTAIIDRQH